MNAKIANVLDKTQFFKEVYTGKDGVLIRISRHQPVNKGKNSEYKVYFEAIVDDKVSGSFIAYCSKEFNEKYIDRKNYYIADFYKKSDNYVIFKKVKKITGDQLNNIKSKMKEIYGVC